MKRLAFVALLLTCLAPSRGEARTLILDDVPTANWEPTEAVTVRSEFDRVTGHDRYGQTVWTRRHRSAKEDSPIQGPLLLENGRFAYAVAGDLFVVKIEGNETESHTRYPAPIAKLTMEDVLHVELATKPPLTLKASDGISVRGAWSEFPLVALRSLRDIPVKGDVLDPMETFEDVLQESTDKALVWGFAGLSETPNIGDAFTKAIEIPNTSFAEDFQLCGLLAQAKQLDDAERMCQRAHTKMTAAGTRPEALYSLVFFVVVTQNLAKAMDAAIKAEDIDAAHRIAGLMHTSFPMVEASFIAWKMFERWLLDHGEHEKAAIWRAHSERIATSSLNRAFWGGARDVDLWLLLIVVALLAVPFAGFASGVASAKRKPADSTKGWRGRLPVPSVLEVAFAIGLFGVATYASYSASVQINNIGTFASAPLAVMQDGFASPEVSQWLDMSLAPSDAQQTLLKFAKAEHAAFLKGEISTAEPPAPELLVDAVTELSRLKSRDEMFDVRLGFSPESIPSVLPLVVPFCLFFFLFAFFGFNVARSPRVTRIAGSVVLGGHAGFIGGVVTASFLAGTLYLLTPLGHILQDISMPSFDRYFGLQSTFSEEVNVGHLLFPMDAWWPWIAIVSAVAIHIATSIVARRSPGH